MNLVEADQPKNMLLNQEKVSEWQDAVTTVTRTHTFRAHSMGPATCEQII